MAQRRCGVHCGHLSTMDVPPASAEPAPVAGESHGIPIVDLSAFSQGGTSEARQAAADALSGAFARTGFAVAVGAGPGPELSAELRATAKSFFGLSIEKKRAVNNGRAAGYGKSPYCNMEENGAQLLGDFSRPPDVVESLSYRGCDEETVRSLPDEPPELKMAIIDYMKGLETMQRSLEAACELALGVTEGYMAERCLGAADGLRLAFYPELLEPPQEGQMRYGAHVDSYGVTILSLDPASPEGLQVEIGGEWVDVPFVEGSLVLNVGALLSRWTNGVWKASVHRVMMQPLERLSIVYGAIRPRDDVIVEVLPSCLGEAAKFPPVRVGDFTAERVALHRPTYLADSGVTVDAVEGLSEEIRSYQK